MLPPSLGEKKKPDLSIQKKFILKFSLHHLLELILIFSLIILQYTTNLLQQCLFQDLPARQHQRILDIYIWSNTQLMRKIQKF